MRPKYACVAGRLACNSLCFLRIKDAGLAQSPPRLTRRLSSLAYNGEFAAQKMGKTLASMTRRASLSSKEKAKLLEMTRRAMLACKFLGGN